MPKSQPNPDWISVPYSDVVIDDKMGYRQRKEFIKFTDKILLICTDHFRTWFEEMPTWTGMS